MSDPFGRVPPGPVPVQRYADAPARRGPAPSTVVNAVRLMLLGAVLGLLSVVVLLFTADDFKRAIREKTPTASDSTINTALGIGVVIGLVVLVLYVGLAFRVRQGRNWARIVTFVIAALGVLSGVSGLAQAGTAASKGFNIIGGIIDAAIIILLVLAPSNRYFRKVY